MAFDLDNLEYLSLEGGGGRGILYVEPINVLEEKLKDRILANYKNKYSEIAAYREAVVTKLKEESNIDGSTLDEGNEGGDADEIDETTLLDPKNGILLPVVNVNGTYSLIQNTIPPHLRLIKGISGSSAGAITAFMLSLGMSSEDIKYEMEREMPLEFPVGDFKGPISVFEQFIDEQPNVFYKRVVDDKPSVGYYPKGETLESLINKSVWRIFEPLDPIRFTSKTAAYRILKNKFSDNSAYGVTAKLFESKTNFEEILERAFLGRGLFVGYKARIYFGNLIKEYLYPQLSGYPLPTKDAGELTFKDFYNLTGVDLVLTGTNITQHAPRYFSVYHTPDFPVIEAVQISMTLPGAFRPVFVNTDVRKGDKKQREKYAGLYVDGGMLNNYPIRAFDNIEIVQHTDSNQNATEVLDDPSKQHINSLTYYGIKSAFPVAGDPRLRNSECNCVLGMRLEELENVKTETEEDKIYPVKEGVFIDFIKSLYKTIGYSSEEGQLRSLEDERRTVKFYASINERNKLFQRLNKKTYNIEDTDKVFTLKVADFSTPAIDKTRGRGSLAKVKDFLIEEAGVRMNDFLES